MLRPVREQAVSRRNARAHYSARTCTEAVNGLKVYRNSADCARTLVEACITRKG